MSIAKMEILMLNRKIGLLCTSVAGVVLLSACGQNEGSEAASDAASDAGATVLANGMTVADQITLRQDALENIGDALKSAGDQLKSGSPDMAVIQTAAATVVEKSTGMEDWFPEGTGPDSGVETDALAVIWEDNPDFLTKVSDMQGAAAKFNEAAQGGDAAAIGGAMKELGGTCKSCHDKYRKDDD